MFYKQVDQMIDELHSSTPAEGFANVFVHGKPEQNLAEKRFKEGIPIPSSVYDFLSS